MVAFSSVGRAQDEEARFSVEEIHAASPSLESPVEVERDDREAQREWQRKVRWYMSLPPEEVVAHPGAAEFPGALAEGAERVERELTVESTIPRWHSTGLYAPAGETVTISLPEEAVELGWKLRVGCHSDSIYRRPSWTRFPEISRVFDLDATEVRVANAFGGLIYIDIPRDEARGGFRVQTYGGYGWIRERQPEPQPMTVTVTVSGAVEAPYFRLGESDPAAWAAQIENAVAPWGEIASRHMVLSLPLEELRKVEDPVALAEFWDEVLDGCWTFAGWPGERQVAERFVFDQQISAGWMHSGYPMMAHLASAKDAVDLEKLRTRGDWGFFHELGHNHQGRAYTFNGFVEVTVNLHTLYLMKTICGLEAGEARAPYRDLERTLRARLLEDRRGPFEELALYIPLIDRFGYEALTRTFQTYLSPDGSEGLTAGDAEADARRRSEWVRRYSQTVGHDCSDYFAMFEIEATPEVREQLSSLPRWMPDETFEQRFAATDEEETTDEAG